MQGVGAVGSFSGWGEGSRPSNACITPPKEALGGTCVTQENGRGGLRGQAMAAVGPLVPETRLGICEVRL